MGNEAVFAMKFAKVFPLLIAKAERKGRTKAEVYEVILFFGYIGNILRCCTGFWRKRSLQPCFV